MTSPRRRKIKNWRLIQSQQKRKVLALAKANAEFRFLASVFSHLIGPPPRSTYHGRDAKGNKIYRHVFRMAGSYPRLLEDYAQSADTIFDQSILPDRPTS